MQLQQDKLAKRVAALKDAVRKADWSALSGKTGAREENGNLLLELLGQQTVIEHESLKISFAESSQECPAFIQAIILFYLTNASGTQNTGNWIRFRDLPEGMHYDQAFQGYTGNRIALEFENESEAFKNACLAVGGRPYDFADIAFIFTILPRLPVLLVCWLGDEEFPPSYQMLFDESASAYMPTDGCAVLGNVLTGKIIGAGKKLSGQ